MRDSGEICRSLSELMKEEKMQNVIIKPALKKGVSYRKKLVIPDDINGVRLSALSKHAKRRYYLNYAAIILFSFLLMFLGFAFGRR